MTAPSRSRCPILDKLQRKRKPQAPFGNCNHPEEETKADHNTCATTDHKSLSSDSSSVSVPSSPTKLALKPDLRPEPLRSHPPLPTAARGDTFGSHHSILPNPSRINTASTGCTSALPPTPMIHGQSLTPRFPSTSPSRETSPSPAPSTFQSPSLSPVRRRSACTPLGGSEMHSSLSAIVASQAEIRDSITRITQTLLDLSTEMMELRSDVRTAEGDIREQGKRIMGNVTASREEIDTVHEEMVQGQRGLRHDIRDSRRKASLGAGSVLRAGLGLGVGVRETNEDDVEGAGEID